MSFKRRGEQTLGKITFVLGGIKTGKTNFAQKRAAGLQAESGLNIGYIATAKALDPAMTRRIEAHRASRPAAWETVEEPVSVSDVIIDAADGKAAVILDCFTMLMTNIIMLLGEEPDRMKAQRLIEAETDAVIANARDIRAELIIISNQVEAGLIAPTRLGGIFQDIAGVCHQKIAAAADEVVLMTAGIPQYLKTSGKDGG